MLSLDTNILLAAIETNNAAHTRAYSFLDALSSSADVVVSEFILLELYVLLRNPAVLATPLSADAAVAICEAFRHHPRWQIVGFPSASRAFHDVLWPKLRDKHFARRRAYDCRVALSLVQQGVAEFATVNVKDFQGMGFARVWNPLSEQ